MSKEATSSSTQNPSALPAGTRLGEYELLSLLGVGGFGIVYLAFDHSLEREVAIKEYMPSSLAGRSETMHVSVRSQSDAETFALGLRSFVNEARLLARFDHPSLLKVHRFWEANGTAYMAMPVMRGRTVKEIRQEMREPPSEVWLRALLEPLLGAIEKLHSEGVYHRDIAPDNIQIEPDGHPVLLDFGAARRVISDKSQALTAILKPAYAPIEQYAEVGAVKQGPWTDIYALGATLHYLLMSRPPPPATARAIHDDASALTTLALPECGEDFLHIVDWMLAPRPGDRPQSVAALRDVLEGRVPTPLRHVPAQNVASDWDRTVVHAPPSGTIATTRPAPRDEEATVVMPAGTPTTNLRTQVQPRSQTVVDLSTEAAAVAQPVAAPGAPGGRSKMLPIALGAAVVAVALAAVALWPSKPAPPAAPVAAGPATAPGAAAPVAPAASMTAESAIAKVVVPSRTPAPATSTSVPTPTVEAAAAPVKAEPAPVKALAAPVAKQVAPPTRSGTTGTTTSPPTTTTAGPVTPAPDVPKPKSEGPGTPAPAAPPPLITATPPISDPPKAAATNPEAKCAGRNPLSYFVCMEKECLKSDQLGTADCQKWRQNARRD